VATIGQSTSIGHCKNKLEGPLFRGLQLARRIRPGQGLPGVEFMNNGTTLSGLMCAFLSSSCVPAGGIDNSSVLADGAGVVKIAADFIFTEGPTADSEGNLYFVDQDNNRIMKYDTLGKLTTFMQPSGYSNGMSFDNKGNLLAAADERNELWSIDVTTGSATTLVSSYHGTLLNAPNDIWVHPRSGHVYFTDPWYPRSWWDRGPQENPPAVYRYNPDDESITRVIDDLLQPNGIIGTPDGKLLYVADIDAGQTFVYAIADDGELQDKRLFCGYGSDGMTVDSNDNVYLTTGQHVQVFDREGRHIAAIEIAEAPSNVAFGGVDGQTLFITARTGLYSVRTRVKGVGPQ
jgi:gluconolactonase